MNLTHSRRWAPSKTLAASLCLLAAVTAATAQEGNNTLAADARDPNFWISPRISVGETFTSDSPVGSPNARGEQVTEITPGIRAVFNGARLKGSLDYSLRGAFYAQNTVENGLQHNLNAAGTIGFWDENGFVDVYGVVDQLIISPFDGTSNSPGNSNRSETSLFRVSPYFKGTVRGAVYELRYTAQSLSTDATNRSDSSDTGWMLRLANRPGQSRLGWSLEANQQQYDYAIGRDTESRSFTAGLSYAVSPQLSVSMTAGSESNDRLTLAMKSYSKSGASVEWRPSDRTRAVVGVDRLYFGTGHNISIEHRTGRTVWRYSDTRGVQNNALEDALPGLGANYDLISLIDNLFASETDPVKRKALIERELINLGSTSLSDLYQRYLSSSATLARNQEFSVLLQGIRGIATFSIFRSNSQRLDSLSTGSDSFDVSSRIQERGWRVLYVHRVTPITSLSASVTGLKISSTNAALGNSRKTLTVGMTTQIGLRTSASVEVLHEIFSGTVNPYRVNSISGVVTHRF